MAAFTNYSELQAALLAVLGRAPDALVYQLVTREINRDMRLREMEATTTATEAASVDLSGEDPEVLSIVQIYRDVDPRCTLRPATAQQIAQDYRTSGTPSKYAFVKDTLLLDAPGSSETLNIRYIGALAEFSGASDTNGVLASYPDVYLYGCLFHHGNIIGDSRTPTWQGAYESAKGKAKAADKRNRHTTAPLTPSIAGATP